MQSNLAGVSLLGRKKEPETSSDNPSDEDVEAAAEAGSARRTTAPKGRPTPKRDSARRSGPVAPAPMTTAEARRRRKEMRQKLTRAERRTERAERRSEVADRRERMMAGEEGFLLPRDRGPLRRYVRDVVDSRRNLLGLFMPSALALIFLMFSVPSPRVQAFISPAMLVLFAIMVVDGFLLGRKVNKLVDQKFRNHAEGRWKLGWYAASRASQLRKMRAPRPQVNRGDKVD